MRQAIVLLALLGSTVHGAELTIKKLDTAIVIDGDLADSGWKNALRIDDFVEYAKGDNTAPPVRTSAWLTYDDRYVYAAFRNDDPQPGAIRAPFVDRDQVLADQDWVSIMLATPRDRCSATVKRVQGRSPQSDWHH